jgi:hypothetical protein
MAELFPVNVSSVCNPQAQYLVIPALEDPEPLQLKSEAPIGRVFIHRLKAPRGLGEYQPAAPENGKATPPGTLHLELDSKQFTQAKRLLLVGATEKLPVLRWTLDAKGAVSALIIGKTEFHGQRISDIGELKTA